MISILNKRIPRFAEQIIEDSKFLTSPAKIFALCFEMFSKASHQPWQLVKISKLHKIIINFINFFSQVFDVSVSSAHRQIFVIARIFNIMQFDNMLEKSFTCSCRGSTSFPTRIVKLSTYWAFTCSNSAIETLEQCVKSVQS